MMLRRKKGFTLIEITVVIGMIIILTGVGFLSYRILLEKTRRIACETNLRAINLALSMYFHDHGKLPDTDSDLVEALLPYDISPSMFHCPDDPVKNRNTYQAFYVQRCIHPDSMAYILGCPYHSRGEKAITLLFGYEPQEVETLKVEVNGERVEFGKPLYLLPGDEIVYRRKTGEEFAHGRVQEECEEVSIIQSFNLPDGVPYGLIKMDDVGKIDFEVTPPSRFEVVTPSTIAGVQGTRFTVSVTSGIDEYITEVEVQKGKVQVVALPRTHEFYKNGKMVTGIKEIIEVGDKALLKARIKTMVPVSIALKPHYAYLKVGEKIKFKVIGYREDGSVMNVENDKVSWSIKPYLWACGTINEDGVYEATQRGMDRVRAKLGNKKAYAYVFVK